METTTPSPQWGDKSSFRMIDVGAKVVTARRAVAEGTIELAEDAFVALRDQTNPKGNVLAMAEVAGIMSAKKTSDTLPLCHPLALDYVRLSFELDAGASAVTVFCEVGTHAKTGVEMEALAGVNGALLAIYDLSKAVNPALTISRLRLNTKEGGKSGLWTHPELQKSRVAQPLIGTSLPFDQIKTGVVTVSDRVSSGLATDRSGPLLAESLAVLGAQIVGQQVVSDDVEKIQAAVRHLIRVDHAKLIITTGGTGLGPRDVTPEALEQISQRMIPGIGEKLRESGAKKIQTSWLSRSLGCVIDETLVIALPGSPSAVSENLAALITLVPHALHTLRGGGHA